MEPVDGQFFEMGDQWWPLRVLALAPISTPSTISRRCACGIPTTPGMMRGSDAGHDLHLATVVEHAQGVTVLDAARLGVDGVDPQAVATGLLAAPRLPGSGCGTGFWPSKWRTRAGKCR